jgi:hypothetical protein
MHETHTFLRNSTPASLCLWTGFRRLQQFNLVAHPYRAVFCYPRADTTTTL